MVQRRALEASIQKNKKLEEVTKLLTAKGRDLANCNKAQALRIETIESDGKALSMRYKQEREALDMELYEKQECRDERSHST